jgi:nitrous oxide reductase accessory protein NosL
MKYFLIFMLIGQLFASYDPRNAQDIQKHFQNSFQAKLATNSVQREYSDLSSLILDDKEYGIKDIKAVDFKTLEYIDAQKAFYVYKSQLKANYGKYSLIAFKNKEDATSHVKEFKGEILSFEEALHVKQKSLLSEANFMLKRYKKRAFPMGEKLYKKLCDDTLDISEYLEIGDVKIDLQEQKLCGLLEEEHLEALTLYLWYVKRKGDMGIIEGQIEVDDTEKCPVCGMFVYKYPKWAAQIFFQHEDHEHHFSFDGVKDLIKFYHDAKKWGNYPFATKENITKILVSDYYSNRGIDGKKAFYVIGSDIYGPMGHEPIPFESEEDAMTFKNEHRGVKVLTFEELSEQLPYNLDIGKFAR